LEYEFIATISNVLDLNELDDAIDEAIKDMWKQEEKPITFTGFFNNPNESTTIEEFLISLNVEEEVISEKWIDYNAFEFERNYQKGNFNWIEYIDPLTSEQITKGKGIKWQIEHGTYTYEVLTEEKFHVWLKELGYETEGSDL